MLQTGYVSIIFIMRKIAALRSGSPTPITCDEDVPDHPIVLRAARRVLEICDVVLRDHPYASMISFLFGAGQALISCGCLFKTILRANSPRDYADDIVLLERVAQALERVAKEQTDFVPLAQAMVDLCKEVQRRVHAQV